MKTLEELEGKGGCRKFECGREEALKQQLLEVGGGIVTTAKLNEAPVDTVRMNKYHLVVLI